MSFLFDGVTSKMASALFDWSALDARVLLLDAAGGAPLASQTTVAAVLGTATEATGFANYARKTLASKSITSSGSTRIFTAASPKWTALGSTSDDLGGAVLIGWGGTDASSWPIGFYSEANQTLAGADYEFSITSSGLIQLAKA